MSDLYQIRSMCSTFGLRDTVSDLSGGKLCQRHCINKAKADDNKVFKLYHMTHNPNVLSIILCLVLQSLAHLND